MSAIITNSGHVLAARQFANAGKFYYKLGHNPVWTTEPATPTESSDVTSLIGMKRVEKVAYVVPDVDGVIEYRGKTYTEVAESEIFEKGAKYVMLTATIVDGDFPIGTQYNQLALVTDVETVVGSEESYVLLPNQITNEGNSALIDYRRTVIIDESSVVHLTVISEF